MGHLGPLLTIIACSTPAWFVVRSLHHHAKQAAAIRAWERYLKR